MSPAIQRRLKEVRSRAAIRKWEYRQRAYSRGSWFRLRRLLAEASAAYAVEESEARRLIEEGIEPDPVGSEWEPAKTILFVTPERRRNWPEGSF